MATVHCLAPLLVLWLAACLSTATADEYKAVRTGPCTANIELDGKVDDKIDLSPLNSADPTKPAFTIAPASGGYDYLYNPCTGLTAGGADGCTQGQQTVCQMSTDKKNFYPAGRTNFTDFTWKSIGIVELVYHEDPANPKARHSYFTLECGQGKQTPNITFLEEKPDGHYHFHFSWAGFCKEIPQVAAPSGLSGGSIIVIIFFPTVLLYFAIGAAVQKFVRGAEGVEVVPNVNFWMSLPGYVADGARFIVSPCRCGGGSGSYEKL